VAQTVKKLSRKKNKDAANRSGLSMDIEHGREGGRDDLKIAALSTFTLHTSAQTPKPQRADRCFFLGLLHSPADKPKFLGRDNRMVRQTNNTKFAMRQGALQSE